MALVTLNFVHVGSHVPIYFKTCQGSYLQGFQKLDFEKKTKFFFTSDQSYFNSTMTMNILPPWNIQPENIHPHLYTSLQNLNV